MLLASSAKQNVLLPVLEELGVSDATAVKVIRYLVKNGWLKL